MVSAAVAYPDARVSGLGVGFVTTGSTFHRRNCKRAMYLGESNSFEFSTHDEAVEAGYRP